MTVRDDGNCLTIQSPAPLVSKVFTWVFGILTFTFAWILVTSLLQEPKHTRIDCDRNLCRFQYGTWSREVPVEKIAGAKMEHRRRTKNSSASTYVIVELKDGPALSLSDSSYHREVTAGMEAAVSGLNQFLRDPERPGFQTELIASDNDWAAMIPMLIMGPLLFYIFLRMWAQRTLDLDRRARTLRVRFARKWHGLIDQTFSFDQIRSISLIGLNWAALLIDTPEGKRTLLYVPFATPARAQILDIADRFGQIVGKPVEISAKLRKRWNLDQR